MDCVQIDGKLAVTGAFIGACLAREITLRAIQLLGAVLLITVAIGLAIGIF